MIEKVNPKHPDKIADRIAGAIVDLAYKKAKNPKIAVEVLIGHGVCHVIVETSETLSYEKVEEIVKRISEVPEIYVDYLEVKQNEILANNQKDRIRCGDNGIFKGMPLSAEQKMLSQIARNIYRHYYSDGKYILDDYKLIICQSKADKIDIEAMYDDTCFDKIINPLGKWTGGISVDTGATNRKLGSDMADSITGGGLHGKDLSKADVSVNIYAFLKAQETKEPVEISVAIGDETVDGKPYSEIVEIARDYIKEIGGFEKFAEWGLY